MKTKSGFQTAGVVAVLLYLTLIIGGGYGWIANVVKLFHADFGHITGELVLRGIGVIAVPLGAIMGYL
jgi:hypothetical protein